MLDLLLLWYRTISGALTAYVHSAYTYSLLATHVCFDDCLTLSILLICERKRIIWHCIVLYCAVPLRAVLCCAVLLCIWPESPYVCISLFLSVYFDFFFFLRSVVFVVVVVSAVCCCCYYYYYSTIGGKVHIHGTSSLSKIQYSLLPRVDQNTTAD